MKIKQALIADVGSKIARRTESWAWCKTAWSQFCFCFVKNLANRSL